ncbi:MAG: hypothetical protein JWQ48_1896 [Conexibacter sp.]|nr:hypothetical protein [Conexibacter sp.]
MTILSIASTCAIILGVAATLPQIATMIRTRSAHGQSPLGWTLGLSVNVLMGYVNLVGFHAALLSLGNFAGAALNAIALACVLRLAVRVATAPHAGVAPAAVAQPLAAFEELPTDEFHVIKRQIDEEHVRREQRELELYGQTA